MKKILLLFSLTLTINVFSQQVQNEWYTDFNEAIEVSDKTDKPLMLFFTGSDWCGWCKKLVREVYKTPEFSKWARKNVVLVDIDFPRRSKLPENIQKQNKQLAQMFGVRGYPTIWFTYPVLDKKTKKYDITSNKLGSTGYVAGGPSEWIKRSNQILNQDPYKIQKKK